MVAEAPSPPPRAQRCSRSRSRTWDSARVYRAQPGIADPDPAIAVPFSFRSLVQSQGSPPPAFWSGKGRCLRVNPQTLASRPDSGARSPPVLPSLPISRPAPRGRGSACSLGASQSPAMGLGTFQRNGEGQESGFRGSSWALRPSERDP